MGCQCAWCGWVEVRRALTELRHDRQPGLVPVRAGQVVAPEAWAAAGNNEWPDDDAVFVETNHQVRKSVRYCIFKWFSGGLS